MIPLLVALSLPSICPFLPCSLSGYMAVALAFDALYTTTMVKAVRTSLLLKQLTMALKYAWLFFTYIY